MKKLICKLFGHKMIDDETGFNMEWGYFQLFKCTRCNHIARFSDKQ